MTVLRQPIKIITALVFAGLSFTLQASELDDVQRLIDSGKNQQALEKLRPYLATNPADQRARFLQALGQQNLGQLDKALNSYEALTRSHPENPEAWNNLAVLYAARGEHNKARDALLSAINTHPSYATAYENLGNIYAKMAVSAYNRALDNGKKDKAGPIELVNINSLPKTKIALASPIAAPVVVASAPAVITAPAVPAAADNTPPAAVIPAAASQPAAQQDQEIRHITDTVNGWVNAWSAQNVDGYLAYYAPGFKPTGGLSRRHWENQRRARLQGPRFIKVTINNPDVFLVDKQSARFSFEQKYKSDRFQDISRKTLQLKKIDGQWQITREYSEG